MNLNPWKDMDRDTRKAVDSGIILWSLIFFGLSWIHPTFQGKDPHMDLAILASLMAANSIVNLYDDYRYENTIRPMEKQLATIQEEIEE